MGWITFHSNVSAKDYFINMFKDETNYELVDIAIKNFRTAFLAVKDKKKDYVFAMIYLLHRAPNSYYNFGYKDMSEFCGPGATDCPKRILDKLSPIEEIIAKKDANPNDIIYTWAKDWRKSCYHTIELNKALKKGKVIKLSNPLKFRSGCTIDRFIKKGKNVYGLYYEREIPVSINLARYFNSETVIED